MTSDQVALDDLRRTEAGLDARIQEAIARLVIHDRRLGATGERIDLLAHRIDTHAADTSVTRTFRPPSTRTGTCSRRCMTAFA